MQDVPHSQSIEFTLTDLAEQQNSGNLALNGIILMLIISD
jgi:hypothetical protein